jgi:hypothetical protein
MANDDRQIRPFADWLLEQRRGLLHAELGEALNGLLDAVIEHHKGGSLTLTVSVKPAGDNDLTVFITDEVKVKKPEPGRPAALFFVDDDKNPRRENPRQQSFASLREVPGASDTSPQEAAQ